MNLREQQELLEHQILSPYASFSDNTKGRVRVEETEDSGLFVSFRRPLQNQNDPYSGSDTDCPDYCEGSQNKRRSN